MTAKERGLQYIDNYAISPAEAMVHEKVIPLHNFERFIDECEKYDYSMSVAIKTIQDERKMRCKLQSAHDSFITSAIDVIQFIDGAEWNMHGEGITKLRSFLSLLKKIR